MIVNAPTSLRENRWMRVVSLCDSLRHREIQTTHSLLERQSLRGTSRSSRMGPDELPLLSELHALGTKRPPVQKPNGNCFEITQPPPLGDGVLPTKSEAPRSFLFRRTNHSFHPSSEEPLSQFHNFTLSDSPVLTIILIPKLSMLLPWRKSRVNLP